MNKINGSVVMPVNREKVPVVQVSSKPTCVNILGKKFDYNNIEELVKDVEYLKSIRDVEKELGIKLITLFKALKNGWFGKNRKYSTKRDDDVYYVVVIDYGNKCIKWSHNFAFNVGNPFAYQCFYFKDYGKTWALTKEELL